jgi:hypothetical protein
MRRIVLGIGITAALCAACSRESPAEARDVGAPGLRVLSQPQQLDTIGAHGNRSLIVEVRGPDSLPMRAVSVVVTGDGMLSADTLSGLPPAGTASALTDVRGRVSMETRFGARAGSARLGLHVPGTSYRDSLLFRVQPGNAVRVRFIRRDTTLLLNEPLLPLAQVEDRAGNARPDSREFQATRAGLSIAGDTVTARAIGEFRLAVRRDGLRGDTITITSMPPVLMAGLTCWTCSTITAVSLDGRERSVIELGGAIINFDWRADSQGILANLANAAPGNLVTARLDGTVSTLAPIAPVQSISAPLLLSARPTSFLALVSDPPPCALLPCAMGIWQIPIAGGTPTRLATLPGGFEATFRSVTTSPDGTHVAFVTASVGSTSISILTLATGEVRTLETGAEYLRVVRWSPTGDRLAFIGARGWGLIDIDGRNRVLNPRNDFFDIGWLDWSGDGRWLAVDARGPGTLILDTRTLDQVRLSLEPGGTLKSKLRLTESFGPLSLR